MTTFLILYGACTLVAFACWMGYVAAAWPLDRDTPEERHEAARLLRGFPMALVWPVVVFGFISMVLREDGE